MGRETLRLPADKVGALDFFDERADCLPLPRGEGLDFGKS